MQYTKPNKLLHILLFRSYVENFAIVQGATKSDSIKLNIATRKSKYQSQIKPPDDDEHEYKFKHDFHPCFILPGHFLC